MKTILKLLNQKPRAYYPIYREITGSTTAGIFLSQLMYWFSKKDKFYKTDAEIREETLLTEKELKSAKSKLKKLSFIKITREGVPAKTYYEIDWNEFEKILNFFIEESNKLGQKDQSSWDERDKLAGTIGTNSMGRKGQTITKNTTKTTSKNTTESKEKNKKEISKIVLEDIEVQTLMNELGVDEFFIYDLLNYRKEIEKPLKTVKGVKKVLKDFRNSFLKTKKSAYELFEIVQENEWLTIQPSYFSQNNQKNYSKKDVAERAQDAIDGFLKMTEGVDLW